MSATRTAASPSGRNASGRTDGPLYAAAMRAEFTVEPFVDGNPGPHVTAAIEAATATGADVSVGPFGSEIEGESELVLQAVDAMTRAAMDAGATRVTIQLNA